MSLFDAWLFTAALLIFALVLLAAVTPPRPPKPCSLCGHPLRRRDVVNHYLDTHQEAHRG